MAQPGESSGSERTRLLGTIADQFEQRIRSGQRVDLQQVLDNHQELAGELRPILEAVLRLSELSNTSHSIPSSYKFIEDVSRSRMARVIKAGEPRFNRLVALKFLSPHLANDDKAVKRFEREAKAAGSLRHPNIVIPYAIGQEQGIPYIAMEWVDGQSLKKLIGDSGPLPTKTIRRLFRGLLAGLDAAQKHGLIHRDIKSANIMVGHDHQANEVVKIVDFGLARLQAADSATIGDISGTPQYMSPEQCRGEDLDHRTDLYSAGVVLYEMLTGRLPFNGESPVATMHQVVHTDPADPLSLNPHCDPNLASLALRLMAKRPNDRLTSASEALTILDTNTQVRRPKTRRQLLAALCTLVLAACASAWTWNAYHKGDSDSIQSAKLAREIHTVLPDENMPTSLVVTYSDNISSPELFCDMGNRAESIETSAIVRPFADQTQIVLVGTLRETGGSSLFAFDSLRNPLWSTKLATTLRWPDSTDTSGWRCAFIAAGDLDNIPGQEIIVSASNYSEYPTRISLIDPHTGAIEGETFWHTGHIKILRIVEDFLGPGLPAIIAVGANNKLDGFIDEEPLLRWNIVPVLLVLDPRDFGGLGPPRTSRIPNLKPAHVHAYAFLNLSTSKDPEHYADGRQRTETPTDYDCASIRNIEITQCFEQADRLCITVAVDRHDDTPGGAELTVNNNLELLKVHPGSGEKAGPNEEYWHEHWIPIIQNGLWLNQQYPAPK